MDTLYMEGCPLERTYLSFQNFKQNGYFTPPYGRDKIADNKDNFLTSDDWQVGWGMPSSQGVEDKDADRIILTAWRKIRVSYACKKTQANLKM